MTAYNYFQRGYELRRDGVLEDAVTALSKAVELEPENGKFLNERGMAYCDAGDLDRAAEDFSAAIALKKRGAAALLNRANVYRLKGDTGKALADLDEVVRIAPGFETAHYFRGQIYFGLGEYEKAIAASTQVMDTVKTNAEKLDKRYKRAGRLFSEGGPSGGPWFDTSQYYTRRGEAYRAAGDDEHAFLDANHALELKPEDIDARLLRGRLYT
jgi:tetratricopeptide (TPR) repeat protein